MSSSHARRAEGRRRAPPLVLFASLVAASIAGCSGSGLVEDRSGAGAPAFDVNAFVAQYCDTMAACCRRTLLPVAPSACREVIASLVPRWNMAVAGACLAEMHAAEAQPDFCGPKGVAYLPSCVALIDVRPPSTGTAALGEACSTSRDCAPPSAGTATCLGKRCAALVAGTKGDGPCIRNVDRGVIGFASSAASATWASTVFSCDLADGVFCPIHSGAEPRRCTAVSGVGGPCDTGEVYQCIEGSICDWGTSTCTSLPVAGEPCLGGLCAAGSHCDSTRGGGLCVASAPLGSSCASDDACASALCSSGRCMAEGNPAIELVCGGF